MNAPQAGDVVWTEVLVLQRPCDVNTVRTGYEPHQIIAVKGDRLIVRSLTTGTPRVLLARDLA